MESIRSQIGHFALPTLLALVVTVGVWSFLQFASRRSEFRSSEGGNNVSDGESVSRAEAQTPYGGAFTEPVRFVPVDALAQPQSPADIKSSSHIRGRSQTRQEGRLPGGAIPQRVDTTGGNRDSVVSPARSATSAIRAGADTVITLPDSASLDTMKLSAWLQDLQKSQPQAPVFEPYQYPLFLQSGVIQHSATIDSTGKYVEIRETLLKKNIRIPIQVPMNEYIAMEKKHLMRTTWEDLAHAYTLTETNALSSLMSGVTNIDIPIPSNPVLSIFGPPRINLRISGAVDIHGGWQNQKINAATVSQLGNVTNQPDFKQNVQINVSGTVGDKLNIGANWDTQNQFNYENQIKIKYSGYPDEVVKSVEAGNVSMSTPSSFIGSNQALFGIKTKMQLGPLSITALASQQKAQGKTLTVSNGSSSQKFSLHAWDYARNHYFIDTMYIAGYEPYLQSNGNHINGNLSVINAEVYVSQPSTAQNTNLRKGYAVMDLGPVQTDKIYDTLRTATSYSEQGWKVESGWFQQLDQSQYSINQQTGVLTLNTSIQSNQIVAIAFQTANAGTYGTLASSDTSKTNLVLDMVVPQNLTPDKTDAWRLMLRNIYATGGLNLDQNSLKDVNITYQPPGQTQQTTIDNVNLLQLFGLDKTGPNGSGPPDGQMDWNPGVDVNPTTGEIIFPYLEPFKEAFADYKSGGKTIANPDSFTYDAIYDTTLEIAQNSDNSRDRFLINGTYSSSVTSHYNLGFNLVQGSVKVLLNGQPMEAGVDYTVDYVTGEVDIKNRSALQAGANVQIQYETNDIFQIGSKSLLGMRADYQVNDNTDIGFTLMGFSRQSPNEKVRLGEEPISNTIMDLDATTSMDLPFLTKALDAIPLIETVAPSSISFHGEAAYMMPNPNTRKSVIPDDNGQGIAYIDDFEGAKRTIPLPITYTNWTMASPPAYSVLDSLYPGIQDSTKNDYRMWTYWFNRIPPQTTVTQIWPKRQAPTDQQTQTVLTIGTLDTVRGQFNRARDLNNTLLANPRNDWGGMMTLLSSNASDLVTQNISYIEVWMQIDQAPGNGVMHIDIGQISEDVIGDRTLHTEDPYGNNTLANDSLDYGIDGWMDNVERAKLKWIVADPDRPWDPHGQDPDGDDYYAPPNFPTNAPDSMYYRVNGTEGNRVTESGRLPDTEDLNHNGTLDLLNSYFEYDVKLDTVKNRFIAGGGSNKWYQYIIPLQDFARAVGNPSLTNVQYVRVWFNGMTGPMVVKIAQMDLAGNYWRTPNTGDSTMQVSVVNIEDNPGYTPPVKGNALRPVDNSNPNGPVLGNEQSLDLILNGLQDDSSRFVYKTFPQAEDFFNYHTMKVFVHGDPSFNYVDSTNYDASVFLRFGTDQNNFYEYRQPIKRGWQDLTIDFAALTSLKLKRDSVQQAVTPVPANNGVPGATYWLHGNPSLQNVTYFQIGIENPPHTGTPLPLVGEVWIDELRLTNVDNTPGLAYQFSSSVKLADLGSISFNYTNIDPYFHSLTTQFGSRNAQRNWGISGSFNLDHFLPRSWVGTSIPFYYTHSESFSNPLYLPNSDILVTEAVTRRRAYLDSLGVPASEAAIMADSLITSSQTQTIKDQWSISNMSIKVPSKAWYIRDIVDDITMGFNWNGSKFRNTQTKSGDQWAWQYNAGYSVEFDPMAYFTPFPSVTKPGPQGSGDFQIRYLPNSFSLSMSASRSLTVNNLWTQTNPIITPDFSAQRSGGIRWKLTNNGILNPTIDYRFNISSSLLQIETDTTANGAIQLLPDSYVFKQIFLNGGLINFGNDYNFSEQFSLSTAPKIPFGIQKYADLQASYNSGYQWNNSVQRGSLGKGAGFNASLQLGTNLRLKALSDSWFGSGQKQTYERGARGREERRPEERGGRRGRGREEFAPQSPDTSSGNGLQIGKLLRYLIKIPLLDFESIGINFSSTNTASNAGLPSLRPGMGNFFRVPFIQESNPELGPSQLYQLGLVSDPYSSLIFNPKKTFPFFSFSLGPTRRVPSVGGNTNQLTDNFSNSNNLDIKTSRNLWPGARINLSWHVGWSYNRNNTFYVDSNGYVITTNPKFPVSTQVSGQVSRSFFTLPPVFIFSMFKSGIKQVGADFIKLKASNPDQSELAVNQDLSKAFVQGFETLPWLDKIFGQYVPRINYSFSWSGLEKLPLFSSFAQQVSLNNAYQSTYTQNWTNTNGAGQVTQAQTISYGFQPLLGMNIAFKSFGNATISGSVLYNTSDQFSLSPSARTIAESYTGQLSITADYAKRGFSLPLFGLNLKNDIDVSASYSISQSSRVSYQADNISSGGTPIDGTNQIAIELRFKYDVSQRVTASIYYKNTRVVPTTPGSPIPGTTTNEAGVDIHVSIAG